MWSRVKGRELVTVTLVSLPLQFSALGVALKMASVPHPTPEVVSLISPGALSPLRIFLSLLVLLIFLLVALFSPKSPRKGPKGARTVLLVGPLASGKTALFSKVSSSPVSTSRRARAD